MGIFYHFFRSTFVRSHTDVGQEGLALSLHSNSSQRCSVRLRSGLCAGQSCSSTPNSLLVSLWTCFVHWCSHVGTGRTIPKLCPQSWELELSNISLLKHSEFLSLELRDQAQKNNPTPWSPSTKLYTWHNAARQVSFSCQLPNPDSSIRLPDGEARETRLHHSRVQWQRALHHCIRRFALHLQRQSACLGACCYSPVAMETIGTPVFNHLDGWVNTFGSIVYEQMEILLLFSNFLVNQT